MGQGRPAGGATVTAADRLDRNLHRLHRDAQRRIYVLATPSADDWRGQTVALASEVEAAVAARLTAQGHTVAMTSHKAAVDLIIDDRLRIEVKASLYRRDTDPERDRWRYQANVRKRQTAADIVIFVCRNLKSGDHYFVIPGRELRNQRSITIRIFDPRRYRGRWAQYLEGWGLIKELLS